MTDETKLPAYLRSRLRPLEDVATPQQLEAINALKQKVSTLYPTFKWPPIMVAAYTGSPMFVPDTNQIVLPLWDLNHAPLTHTIADLGHESWHAIAHQLGFSAKLPEDGPLSLMRYMARPEECAADHHSARVTGRPKDLIASLNRPSNNLAMPHIALSFQETLDQMKDTPIDSHPINDIRAAMLKYMHQNPKSKFATIPTEHIVFGAHCDIKKILPPSPTPVPGGKKEPDGQTP